MAQDIRDMFQDNEAWTSDKLKKGHQKRFGAKLDEAFPKQRSTGGKYFFLKIAAVLVVAFGVGFYFLNSGSFFNETPVVETPVEQEEEEIPTREFQLSEVSPEYKRIEDYYLASLNIELAKLEVSEDNKALIDGFMARMAELDREYKRLNTEFNQDGANEQTVEAMIANLQLRLELLYKLKNKLKEIKDSKNENYENLQA